MANGEPFGAGLLFARVSLLHAQHTHGHLCSSVSPHFSALSVRFDFDFLPSRRDTESADRHSCGLSQRLPCGDALAGKKNWCVAMISLAEGASRWFELGLHVRTCAGGSGRGGLWRVARAESHEPPLVPVAVVVVSAVFPAGRICGVWGVSGFVVCRSGCGVGR